MTSDDLDAELHQLMMEESAKAIADALKSTDHQTRLEIAKWILENARKQ